jgi:hypothetical protein
MTGNKALQKHRKPTVRQTRSVLGGEGKSVGWEQRSLPRRAEAARIFKLGHAANPVAGSAAGQQPPRMCLLRSLINLRANDQIDGVLFRFQRDSSQTAD